MFTRNVMLLSNLLTLSSIAAAEEPTEVTPSLSPSPPAPSADTPPPAPTPGTIPLAQLLDARAGEAFIGQEVTIEGAFYGMAPIDAVETIQIPRKYRKTYTRFMLGGAAGSITRNLIVPTEQAGPLYSMAVGTTHLRVTGTLEHILSPMMVQPIDLNRLLIVSKFETF